MSKTNKRTILIDDETEEILLAFSKKRLGVNNVSGAIRALARLVKEKGLI